MTSTTDFVTFNVGGMYDSLLLSDIQRHTESYFAAAVRDEWNNSDHNAPITIQRDGVMFQHIFAYLYMDHFELPYRVMQDSLSFLVSLRDEADYFNLSGLVKWCEKQIKVELPGWCLKQATSTLCAKHECVQDCGENPNILANLYGWNFFPTVDSGILVDIRGPLFRSSTIGNINVPELLQYSCKMSDTLTRMNVHYLEDTRGLSDWQVNALMGCLPTLINIPCRLASPQIYSITTGGSWARFLTSFVNLGGVIYILQGAESGGTITITQNGRKHSIHKTGDYAMYGCDCVREIDTITAGTLVFLYYSLEAHDPSECDFYDDEPLCVRGPRRVSAELAMQLVDAVHKELHIHENSQNDSRGDCECGEHDDDSEDGMIGERARKGVVLCLRKFYAPEVIPLPPSTNTTPSSTRTLPPILLETDPVALKGRDAHLHAALVPHFDITLVTVFVARPSKQQQSCQCCVLGQPRIAGKSEHGTRLKVIVPPQGFGDQVLELDRCNTLFTGLHIRPKVSDQSNLHLSSKKAKFEHT